jgi:hypothetical protein
VPRCLGIPGQGIEEALTCGRHTCRVERVAIVEAAKVGLTLGRDEATDPHPWAEPRGYVIEGGKVAAQEERIAVME